MIHPARVGRRAAAWIVAAVAVAAIAHGQAQDPARSPWHDALRDLAARLAASLSRTEPFDLAVAAPGAEPGFDARSAEADLASLLGARGLRPTRRTDSLTHVRVSCSESVQGRLCAAEIVRGDSSAVVFGSRLAPSGEPAGGRSPVMALNLRPILAQAGRLLDVAVIDGQRIAVLDVTAVTVYERSGDAWRAGATTSVERTTPWPRDARGRLVVGKGLVEAFLPGRTCRGTLEPLRLACSDAREPWPLGVENDGLEDGRNYFTSARTAPFYAIAPVQTERGASWVVSAVDGGLRLLDQRLQEEMAIPGPAGDVVALASACGSGRSIVLNGEESAEGAGDALRAFEMANGRRVPVIPPVILPGSLVALWPSNGNEALAIVRRHGLDRYEAFLVGLSCAR